MNDTKNETENDSPNALMRQAVVILTKLQDAVSTGLVTGSTSINTRIFSSNKAVLARSAEITTPDSNWIMTIEMDAHVQSSASDATTPSDASTTTS